MADTLLGIASLRFAQFGYIIVGLGTLAEGVSLPFPSVIFVIMAGAAVTSGRMSFWAVIMLASTAYTVGAIIPYYLGYNMKRLNKYPWMQRFVGKLPQPAIAVNNLFVRHGSKIVALSRPFWIGNCVSYFAGLNHMSTVKFVVYTFLGILPWAIAATYAGTIFGANTALAIEYVSNYTYLLLGLGVALLSVKLWKLSLKRRKQPQM